MKYIPLSDRVLIEPITLSEVDSFGLLRANSQIENTKSYIGRVIAVSKPTEYYKPQLKVGDIVFYDHVRTTKIDEFEVPMVIIREDNVNFIVTDESRLETAHEILKRNLNEEQGENKDHLSIPFDIAIKAMEEYALQISTKEKIN